MPHALATRDLERQRLLVLNGRGTAFFAFVVAPLVSVNLALQARMTPSWQFWVLTAGMVGTGFCWAAAHLLNRRGRLRLSVGLAVGVSIAFDVFAIAMRQEVFAAAMIANIGMMVYCWVFDPPLAIVGGVLIFCSAVVMRLLDYLSLLPAVAPSRGLVPLLDLTVLGCALPIVIYVLRQRVRLGELPYRALARQHRWLEAVIRQIPMPLVLLDSATGEVEMQSLAAEAIIGRHEAPAAAGEPGEPSGKAVLLETLDRALRGHCFEAEELSWRSPEGERMTGLCVSRLLPAMPGHEATGLVAILDVTGLKQAQRELEIALEAREEFLTVASHELKTPLTALTLQLDGMAREVARHPGRVDAQWLAPKVASLQRQSRRLTGLVHGLLDGARIQAGRLELAPESLDLRAVAAEVLSRFRHEAAAAGCRLDLEAAAPVAGIWDRACLDHVLTNLISNAIKYGAGNPVELAIAESEGCARIAVADRGIGISEQDQGRLFRRFERLHHSPEYRGFGLGLWIVRSAVERMDGRIEVRSAPGEGSRFVVFLPLEQRAARMDRRAVASSD